MTQRQISDLDYSRIVHESASMNRITEHNPGERAFLEVWQQQNQRHMGINGGFAALELILCPPTDGRVPRDLESVPAITQRDALVAASVIQWLGTNGGISFLLEAEDRFRKYRDAMYAKERKEGNRLRGALHGEKENKQ